MNLSENNKGLICIGLNTIDIQFLVDKYPESNTKVKAEKNEVFTGGPATNAAITAAFLGVRTDLFTPVGEHVFTGFLCQDLQNNNVRLIDPAAGEQWIPTFASIITDAQDGKRTVISYHSEIKSDINLELNFLFNDYQVALFDGFYPEFAIPIARECKKQGIVTVLDGGSWKKETQNILPYIDIALCSADFQVPGGVNKSDIFRHLHEQGIRYAAITRGEENILISDAGKTDEVRVEKLTVCDTLGAGDIFHGAFCFYYITGCKFADAVLNASKIAGESCRYFGTRQWMEHYNEQKRINTMIK